LTAKVHMTPRNAGIADRMEMFPYLLTNSVCHAHLQFVYFLRSRQFATLPFDNSPFVRDMKTPLSHRVGVVEGKPCTKNQLKSFSRFATVHSCYTQTDGRTVLR